MLTKTLDLAKAILAVVLCLIATNTRAQVTHTLPETARNHGGAEAVAVGADGTVFAANKGMCCPATCSPRCSDGSLKAYSYDGSSLDDAGHVTTTVNHEGWAKHVVVVHDGTVFLANYDGGLRVGQNGMLRGATCKDLAYGR